MTRTALTEILALGTLTGMRSMAGPATVAFRYGGRVRNAALVLAAGEMVVDKLPIVGDRIEAAPLVGRAVMGALAGGMIAREARGRIAVGAVIGAAAAVAAAHLAYRARRGLHMSAVTGGLLEDAIVVGAGALLARRG
jgi:uncharacterized membrane protein